MIDSSNLVNQDPQRFCGRRRGSGFTLLEILVVSVIMAALAAVAIPIYSGFVANQRQEAVKKMAQTAAMSADVFFRRTGANPANVADLKFFNPDTTRYGIWIINGGITVSDTSVNPVIEYHVNF